MTSVARRDFLLTAGAAALLAARTRPASAQSGPKIRVVTIPIDISAEPYYAAEQGFFRAVGLDAEISVLGNGPAVVAAVVGGNIEFGSGGTTSIALARERGIPLVMVAPAGVYSPSRRTHGMVVRADSPIRTPRDLAGKTLGESGLKNIGDIALHAWLDRNGIDYASVKILEIPYPSQIAALEAGRIDAADLEQPYLDAALAQGARFFANVFDAIAPQWVEGAFFCTESYAQAHPDVIRKFADAMAKAAAWGNGHRAEAAHILAKYAHSATMPDTPLCLYTERLRAADIQPLIDASAKYGLLAKAVPAKELFAPGLGE